MAEIAYMVYEQGIPDDTVTNLIISAKNDELIALKKQVASHTEVWDGPVNEAATSEYASYFPDFIRKPRFQDRNRIKVLAVEIEPIPAVVV